MVARRLGRRVLRRRAVGPRVARHRGLRDRPVHGARRAGEPDPAEPGAGPLRAGALRGAPRPRPGPGSGPSRARARPRCSRTRSSHQIARWIERVRVWGHRRPDVPADSGGPRAVGGEPPRARRCPARAGARPRDGPRHGAGDGGAPLWQSVPWPGRAWTRPRADRAASRAATRPTFRGAARRTVLRVPEDRVEFTITRGQRRLGEGRVRELDDRDGCAPSRSSTSTSTASDRIVCCSGEDGGVPRRAIRQSALLDTAASLDTDERPLPATGRHGPAGRPGNEVRVTPPARVPGRRSSPAWSATRRTTPARAAGRRSRSRCPARRCTATSTRTLAEQLFDLSMASSLRTSARPATSPSTDPPLVPAEGASRRPRHGRGRRARCSSRRAARSPTRILGRKIAVQRGPARYVLRHARHPARRQRRRHCGTSTCPTARPASRRSRCCACPSFDTTVASRRRPARSTPGPAFTPGNVDIVEIVARTLATALAGR